MVAAPPHLVVLYGVGGLSDVGRHAVAAALARDDGATVTVLTKHPQLLAEPRWNCGCPEDHQLPPAGDGGGSRLKVVALERYGDMAPHFRGATAVVSCLGNRQPFLGHYDAEEGTTEVLKAMAEHNVGRLVCVSSVGIGEDWPAMEWHWSRYIMGGIFRTIGRPSFRDLSAMEALVRGSDRDYLLVRPVGIPEDLAPVGGWYIQQKKWEDRPFFVMAKLDVARFMVEEAIHPTRHKEAVVIGAEPKASTVS